MTENIERVYRKDYTPPDYRVDTIDLTFDIRDDKTTVKATSTFRRTDNVKKPLVLMGQELKLIELKLNGKTLSPVDYTITEETLTINDVPEKFTLEVTADIFPASNTALEGLYASGPMLCTQCEAEGFRRITYYPDRPDVMAKFTTTLEGDKKRYPVLLSNGNPIKREDLGARHRVTWEDPFPKPCYLFAAVAGDLKVVEDSFTTMSGRKVKLEIYCEPGKEGQLAQAMKAVKDSMAWDEKRFGREYDLDIFMIVATSFFNSGAMENKGLNIFNTAYVLGEPRTATDSDLQNIEAVVGHEYFHNWSGDRVTCRDWFQLSLKEGFTVFREQEFCRDMHSEVTERIEHVRLLRNAQFVEDSGPMAHPIRPDSYVTIDNFYTTTVYEKGAEVIRMMQVLFGKEGFRKGSDLYFSRFDGQAATCDDFAEAIFEANKNNPAKVDLEHFKLWYSQAGTPRVKAETHYDAATKTYTLKLSQTIPPTPGQKDKKPMVIPVMMGLLGKNGQDLPGTSRTLVLDKVTAEFKFENIGERPVPSLLRHFSAPISLEYEYSEAELAFLMSHDPDLLNRWDAAQKFAVKELFHLMENKSYEPKNFITAFGAILKDYARDPDFAALCMLLPGESEIGQLLLQQGKKINVDGIHAARDQLRLRLAQTYRNEFQAVYEKMGKEITDPLATDGKSMALRRLKNLCLAYLMLLNDEKIDRLAFDQMNKAANMTDEIAGLGVLTNREIPLRVEAISHFYNKWKDEELLVDKWFALQAMADRPGVAEEVQALTNHPAFSFTNPNKVHSLVGGLCANLPHFHRKDGVGYRFLADVVLKLDPMNPQIAGRRLQPLTRWRNYDEARGALMRAQLERILKTPGLSKNTLEVASAALEPTAEAA
jgi:aminopeptidase N